MLERLVGQVLAGLQGVASAPARLDCVTPYGRHVLRAWSLEPAVDGGPRTFGVQIERRLPLSVKLMRSARFHRLTAREQDIAQLLATGDSYPAIASRLDLSASTVVTHVRNLGRKLGTAGREEIVRALCA